MRLVSGCQECINNSDNFWDFLSSAMELIDSHVPDDMKFEKTYYLDKPEFRKLTEAINKKFGRPVSFVQIKRFINSEIYSLSSPSNDLMESLGVLYAVMKGIDLGINQNPNRSSSIGPLDSAGSHRFRVYRRPKHSLNDDFLKWFNREPVNSKSLICNFTNFFFLDMTDWNKRKGAGIPQGKKIVPESSDNKGVFTPENGHIKVAISPICKEKNFEFKGDMSFVLAYHETQVKYCNMIEKILELSSSNECDFLVLPEYIISPEMSETIERKLKSMKAEGKHTPILTFAGSQWTAENNNVQYFFDESGNKKGEYYKWCNYRRRKSIDKMISEENPEKKRFLMEGLNDPGKVCEFICVDGIGIILPSICRDIFDPDYTRFLSNIIKPLMIFNSAWSGSVDYMGLSFDDTMNQNQNGTVFANACSAVENREVIGSCGLFSVKKEDLPRRTAFLDKKSLSKAKTCDDCAQGCLFIADFFFGRYLSEDYGEDAFELPSLNVKKIRVE